MSLEMYVARYLLSALQEERTVSARDLILHVINSEYDLGDLLSVVYHLECDKYINSEKHDKITITQKGIDHFFRVSEGDL